MRNKIFIIIVLALSLRLGLNIIKQTYVLKAPFYLSGEEYHKSLFNDEVWYDSAAVAFLKGKGVLSAKKNELQKFGNFAAWVDTKEVDGQYSAHKFVPPLYPLFISLCYFLGGENTLAFFIPQIILSSLTCVFVYLLGKEIFNDTVGYIAGIAAACYPDLVYWTYRLHTENLFIFFLALGLWLLVRGNSSKNILLISFSAAVMGFACLTRIVLLPFVPFIFLWEIYLFRHDKKLKFMAPCVVVLLIGLVLLPWCLRNFVVFGKFTPLTDEINSVFFETNNSIEHAKNEFNYRLHPYQIDRIILHIKDNFGQYAIATLRRFVSFWSPFTAPMQTAAKIYKGITWLIIFPLAFYGMSISRVSWKKSGLVILFILYYSLIHALSFVDNGLVYRYPIQPFLCIFAGYGFWFTYNKSLKKRT